MSRIAAAAAALILALAGSLPAAAAQPAPAAPPPAPPVEAYGRPPNISMAALSPDGKSVAFVRNFAGRKDLIVRAVGTKG